MNAALRYFERRQSAAEKPYFEADNRLERALQFQIAECVVDALTLVGITDNSIKAEICRCVIEGGTLLDGEGFMEGQPIDEWEEAQKAA